MPMQGTLEFVVTFSPIGMATSAAAVMFAKGDADYGKKGAGMRWACLRHALGGRKSLLPNPDAAGGPPPP